MSEVDRPGTAGSTGNTTGGDATPLINHLDLGLRLPIQLEGRKSGHLALTIRIHHIIERYGLPVEEYLRVADRVGHESVRA